MSSGLCTPKWALVLLALAFATVGCDRTAARNDSETLITTTSKPPPVTATRECRRRFFVAPTGRDSNRGARRRPFGKLAHALRKLRDGDGLYVRGGVYRERVKVS